MKTIRLSVTGNVSESMSFPTIDYMALSSEKWDDSPWHETLESKFFFVVFQEEEKNTAKDSEGKVIKIKVPCRLVGAFFWNMPINDLNEAHRLWADTRSKVLHGDFCHFGKSTESSVCHVRPHGKNASDLTLAPDGSMQKKYCFWLNKGYIQSVIDRKFADKIQP